MTAINQSEESKKNLPAEPEDSAAKKEKNNLYRRPLEEIVPIMHGTFKKMLFKFVTQQWSAVLRDDNWNGWDEFKEYFGSMHLHGHCWGWKKKDIQYEAWDELKDFVESDPCCEDLRSKTYSPEELDEAQARLIAYVRRGRRRSHKRNLLLGSQLLFQQSHQVLLRMRQLEKRHLLMQKQR